MSFRQTYICQPNILPLEGGLTLGGPLSLLAGWPPLPAFVPLLELLPPAPLLAEPKSRPEGTLP